MSAVTLSQSQALDGAPALEVTRIHAEQGGFLWATLQRLGARPADLDDLYQEVILVVHRRLPDYDRGAPLRPWLFGICVRVVAGWRRRAHVRRETLVDEVPESHAATPSPEEDVERARAQAVLRAVLDELDLERRAVFVMYEIDEVPCAQIAEMIGVPVGTVHSRLHAARKEFQQAAARWQKRNGGVRR